MSVAPINHATTAAAANLAAGGNQSALRNLPQSEQIKAAAGQFEAMMLRQLLQDSVGKLAGGEKSGGGMYGFMMTDVLANQLSAGGGLGLSKVFAQQLTPKGMNLDAPADGREIK